MVAKDLALKVLGVLAVGGTVVGGGLVINSLKGGEDKSSTATTGNTSQGEKIDQKKQENQTPSDKGPGVKGDGGANAPLPKEPGDGEPNIPPDKGPGGKEVPDRGAEGPGLDRSDRAQEDSLGSGRKAVPERVPGGPQMPGIPEVKVKALEEMGLNCGTDNICTLITGKSLSVKQDNKTRTLTALPAGGQGKIRISRSQDGDETRSALNIEGGDITPTWGEGGDDSITKLEEFETYEVEKVPEDTGNKYYFKRRSTANREIEMKLGLDKCTLPTSSTEAKSCSITSIQLTSMNFDGKKEDESPSIDNSESTTLTITKLEEKADKDYSRYPFGYQFVLSGDKEVRIPALPSEIIKKANVSLGFRIKKNENELTLEKVSQIDRLAWKLGLTECNTTATTCRFSEKINVYKDEKNNIRDGKISDLTNQIITYQENDDGYEGGIKFTVSKDISFDPEVKEGTFSRIESGDYEAKEQTVNGEKHWYLTKRNS